MRTSVAANHHFLPQVYLRQFTKRRSGRELWVFDKKGCVPYRSTPKESAHVAGLYAVHRNDHAGESERIERQFGDIEQDVPWLYETLRHRRAWEEKAQLTFVKLIASTFIRVPRYLQRVHAARTALVAEEFERVRSDPAFLAKVEAAGIPKSALERAYARADKDDVLRTMMLSFKDPAVAFCQMSWQMLVAPPGTHFITGDCPVCCCKPDVAHGPFDISLNDQAIEITFPLSRDICAYGVWSGSGPLYSTVAPAEVVKINHRTFDWAQRWTYGPEHDPSALTGTGFATC